MARNEEHTIQFVAKMLWKYRGAVKRSAIVTRLLECDCIRRNYSKGTILNLVQQFRAWIKDPECTLAKKIPQAYMVYLNKYREEDVNFKEDIKEDDYDNFYMDKFSDYDKPLKVTRAPKKREQDYFTEEIPPFTVEETDKTNEIKRVLSEEPIIEETEIKPEISDLTPPRDIKIDVNDPESLPIPKSLNSYVIYNGGLVTSKEAFDELAVNVNKEIMLEIPSLNDLSDRFLSHVPTIYSRVIIDEFDVSDMSYMFLISSLLKQGVHIRTIPKVHTVNLITDDSHAMILSEGQNDLEYGAIFDDRRSISDIRSDFEKTWSIASNLDENILMSSMAGGNA